MTVFKVHCLFILDAFPCSSIITLGFYVSHGRYSFHLECERVGPSASKEEMLENFVPVRKSIPEMYNSCPKLFFNFFLLTSGWDHYWNSKVSLAPTSACFNRKWLDLRHDLSCRDLGWGRSLRHAGLAGNEQSTIGPHTGSCKWE